MRWHCLYATRNTVWWILRQQSQMNIASIACTRMAFQNNSNWFTMASKQCRRTKPFYRNLAEDSMSHLQTWHQKCLVNKVCTTQKHTAQLSTTQALSPTKQGEHYWQMSDMCPSLIISFKSRSSNSPLVYCILAKGSHRVSITQLKILWCAFEALRIRICV